MARPRDESVGFADLLMQARITNRLLAAQLKATTGQQDLVRLLASTGASNQEIADVLDTTAATVATTLQRIKKRNQDKERTAPAAHKLLGAGTTDANEP